MGELLITCHPKDKDKLKEFFEEDEKKADTLDGWQGIPVEWYDTTGRFEYNDTSEDYYSYWEEIVNWERFKDAPPFFAHSLTEYPWAAIYIGDCLHDFVVNANGAPTVSLFNWDLSPRNDIYDQLAEAYLFVELKREFEIYMKMRG